MLPVNGNGTRQMRSGMYIKCCKRRMEGMEGVGTILDESLKIKVVGVIRKIDMSYGR